MRHDVIVISYQVAWGWTAGTSRGTQSGPALWRSHLQQTRQMSASCSTVHHHPL